MRRRQFANATVDAERSRDVLQVKKKVECLGVQSAIYPRKTRKWIDLRAEGEIFGGRGVVEGLLSEAVAGEEQALRAGIPDREGEHAAQEAQTVDAMLPVEGED